MFLSRFSKLAAVALGMLVLVGCSLLSDDKSQSPSSIFWTTDSQPLADRQQLVMDLQQVDYVILGERHDNAEHHAIQLEVLQELFGAGWLKQLSLEMLRPRQQAGMDEAYAKKLPFSDELRDTIGWDKNWNWDYYGPIVAWAIASRVPLRSGNLDRDELTEIYQEKEPPSRETVSDEGIKSIRDQIRKSHCGMENDTMLDARTRIQQARDARMATGLLRRKEGVALLAGAFHARKDVGVPLYVRQKHPQSELITVGLVETSGDADLDSPGAWAAQYDIVWFTNAVSRKTPCELMKKNL